MVYSSSGKIYLFIIPLAFSSGGNGKKQEWKSMEERKVMHNLASKGRIGGNFDTERNSHNHSCAK